MRLIMLLLRPFFYLLYHQFAWSYDFVAAVVSLGRWQEWVRGILPYVEGPRVLELGYGPGHLQAALNEKGIQVFGLDESRFMGRLASERLKRKNHPARLSHGYAQELPFAPSSFDTVAATFPSEYILDPQTLAEIHRVLVPGGQAVILPLAWITGRRLLERLAAWLFRITGEVHGEPGRLHPAVRERLEQAGFDVRGETVKQDGSMLLIILATRKTHESVGTGM